MPARRASDGPTALRLWSRGGMVAAVAHDGEPRHGEMCPMPMRPPCDGCAEFGDLTIVSANGVQARYCRECLPAWQALETACNAEALRLQRLLALFWQDVRTRSPLRVTPLDFTAFVAARSNGVVLG